MHVTDEMVDLIHEAIRFAFWAAGEGFCAAESFLFDYSTASGDEDLETLADRVSAALRAAPAVAPVAVKPLEWRNGCASTSIGNYLVVEEDWDEDPFWFVIFNGKPLNKLGVHRSEAEAISAAQNDYERRIRESLVAAAPTEAGR